MFITLVRRSGAVAEQKKQKKTLNLVPILSKRLVSPDCTSSTNLLHS